MGDGWILEFQNIQSLNWYSKVSIGTSSKDNLEQKGEKKHKEKSQLEPQNKDNLERKRRENHKEKSQLEPQIRDNFKKMKKGEKNTKENLNWKLK